MKKRIMVFLITLFLLGIVPIQAEAAYNAQAAVDYAVANYSKNIACDQFVKACLKAGGITITTGTVDNVRAALLKYGTEYKVNFSGGVCYQKNNPNIAVGTERDIQIQSYISCRWNL